MFEQNLCRPEGYDKNILNQLRGNRNKKPITKNTVLDKVILQT